MYQTVTDVLDKLESDISAAEAQGLATGMLCVEIKTTTADWLTQLLENSSELPEHAESQLTELFNQTRQALQDDLQAFSYAPLLPDDDDSLYEQVEGLKHWCQGFLFGVGYQNSTSGQWPAEIAEIIQDIVELSKADSNVEDEEDENALMEITEYLRAAVYTVRDFFLDMSDNQKH